MFPKIAMVRTALESLYDAKAAVYTYTCTIDAHHITTQKLTKLISDLPCRISYQRNEAAQTTDTVDTQDMMITMIYSDTSIAIPAGSQIMVTWDDGRTDAFENASVPSVYTHHAEVRLGREKDKP